MKTEPMPQEIVRLLEVASSAPSWAAELVNLGRSCYRDGKAGRPYLQTELPAGFRKEAVEAVERFALACWMQGQDDGRAGV